MGSSTSKRGGSINIGLHSGYTPRKRCNCSEQTFDFSSIKVWSVKRLQHKMMIADLGGLITHDSITLTYFCSNCFQSGRIVMEYGLDGKKWWRGQYLKFSKVVS